jgi:hypothetical protein
MTRDVSVFVGTLVQMRAFAVLVFSDATDGNVPRQLMEASAVSMLSQIEADLAFHPETKRAVESWEQADPKEGV